MEDWAIALIIIGAVLFASALVGGLVAVIIFASKRTKRSGNGDQYGDEDESSDEEIDYFDHYPFDETSDTEDTQMIQRPRIPNIKV